MQSALGPSNCLEMKTKQTRRRENKLLTRTSNAYGINANRYVAKMELHMHRNFDIVVRAARLNWFFGMRMQFPELFEIFRADLLKN